MIIYTRKVNENINKIMITLMIGTLTTHTWIIRNHFLQSAGVNHCY